MVSPTKVRPLQFFPASGARIAQVKIGCLTIAPLLGLLALAAPAHADNAWVLWGGAPGKEAAGARISAHRALGECLEERRSWQEKQRAYLRAANESRPQDQLPSPVRTDSYRCLPDTTDPSEPRRN
jgi:hypothetical protein